MKMVKSLLLGTAAGLVAVAGAKAADLPVKAKPVEYVKVCSVYGEGFFYVPGTDTCIKIGGFVRQDYEMGQVGTSFSPEILGTSGRDNPIDQFANVLQSTFQISADVRSQTEYGTLRSYARFGFRYQEYTYADGTYVVDRAFIQLGGWTFGRTASFFDYLNGAFSYQTFEGGGSGSAFGVLLGAYTYSFGNGVSFTSSIENAQAHRNWLWDATPNNGQSLASTTLSLGAQTLINAQLLVKSGALGIGSVPLGPNAVSAAGYTTCGSSLIFTDRSAGTDNSSNTGAAPTSAFAVGGCSIGDYAIVKLPDFVSQFRVDQAWGSAQIASAIHQVTGGYYGNNVNTTDPSYTGVQPADKYGWAVMGGISLNIPWNQGDKFWVEATYSQGAPNYAGFSYFQLNNTTFLAMRDNRVAFGWVPDAVFSNMNCGAPGAQGTAGAGAQSCGSLVGSGLRLTTAFSIGAAFEHFWTPAIRTSLWGVFSAISFDDTAKVIFCNNVQNSAIRPTAANPAGATGLSMSGGVPLPGCNPNFNVWSVGVRTIWNPVKNLDVGLEVYYAEIDQKYNPNLVAINFSGGGGQPSGTYTPANLGIVGAMLRVQRNFWP